MQHKKEYLKPGVVFAHVMQYSEVCIHMQITCKTMACELLGERMVRLYMRLNGEQSIDGK